MDIQTVCSTKSLGAGLSRIAPRAEDEPFPPPISRAHPLSGGAEIMQITNQVQCIMHGFQYYPFAVVVGEAGVLEGHAAGG
jgi:hypothetical protein